MKSIDGHKITVHCTVTGQMVGRPKYFEEFASFWSNRQEVKQIWFSLFTPQVGAEGDEILSPTARAEVLTEFVRLRDQFPKLVMPDSVIEGYRNPPKSPDQCIFSRTTLNLTADRKGRITPCQFGGNPDCSQCGCIASAGLKAVGDHRLFGVLPLRSIFKASDQIGRTTARMLGNAE